jgi:predicted RNase H-like HicB family nuclease
MMIGYRVDLAPDDNGSLLVTCPQLPMVATFGETREDALSHALDAIETALASMIDDGEKIPRPKAADLAKDDGLTVRLPAPVPARSPLAAGAARGGFQGARPPGRRRGQGGSLGSRPQWHGTALGDSIAAMRQ